MFEKSGKRSYIENGSITLPFAQTLGHKIELVWKILELSRIKSLWSALRWTRPQ